MQISMLMQLQESNRDFCALIYLCKCAVNGLVPERELVLKMDLERLYKISKEHMVVAMVAYALEAAGIKDPRFVQAREKAIRKNMLLDNEREKLFAFMEEQGIWYMPLKGSLLKEIYPKLGMRQMSDNDILFDKTYANKVRDFFVDAGYAVKDFDAGLHDVYTKPPVLEFEMHKGLLGSEHGKEIATYYDNIFKQLVRDEHSSYGYHFTDEDFYVYMIAHEYKHYSGQGTGLRSLIDTYVYLSKKGTGLDFAYIETACEKLKLAEFERKSRALAMKVLNGKADAAYWEDFGCLSEEEDEMLMKYLRAGTYGTVEYRVSSRLQKLEKRAGRAPKAMYLLERFCPTGPKYRRNHPIIYKSVILVPFYWVFRLIRGALFRRKKITNEMRIVNELIKKKK